ncbi:MAG TPA: hypothetical protein P5293_02055 [Bacteroidales bacterium]|nr:hypothetical protein [Bacteroidales bacterium]
MKKQRVLEYKYVGVVDRLKKDLSGREDVFCLYTMTDTFEQTKALDCRMFPFKRIAKVKIVEIK